MTRLFGFDHDAASPPPSPPPLPPSCRPREHASCGKNGSVVRVCAERRAYSGETIGLGIKSPIRRISLENERERGSQPTRPRSRKDAIGERAAHGRAESVEPLLHRDRDTTVKVPARRTPGRAFDVPSNSRATRAEAIDLVGLLTVKRRKFVAGRTYGETMPVSIRARPYTRERNLTMASRASSRPSGALRASSPSRRVGSRVPKSISPRSLGEASGMRESGTRARRIERTKRREGRGTSRRSRAGES